MKYTAKTESPAIALVLLSWIAGIYFYLHFPDRVITHWSFRGIANGYSSKTTGALIFPLFMTIIYILFIALPFLDPKKENYVKFEKYYHWFKDLFLLFMLAIFIITGAVNLGAKININFVVPFLVGVLFIALGSMMKKVKQNWFVGFRFPWSLSSENVWNKTNRFGGWSLMLCGAFMMFVPLLGETLGRIIFAISILQLVFGTMIYSYLEYRKEQKTGPKSS